MVVDDVSGYDKAMHWINTYYYSTERHGVPSDSAALLAVLDEDEQARFERYRFDHSRWTFATARWILKTQLADHLQCTACEVRFHYSENGKPSLLDEPKLHFNLSHTDTGIVVAISNRLVGVDIELLQRRGDPWKTAEGFLNDYAADIINEQANDELKQLCFARYWCAMEALVKLTGSTLFTVKNHFGKTLRPLIEDGHYSDERNEWRMKKLGENQYLSIASPLGLDTLKEYEFNGEQFI